MIKLLGGTPEISCFTFTNNILLYQPFIYLEFNLNFNYKHANNLFQEINSFDGK